MDPLLCNATTKVRLFRETEQKGDKNTIKVRELIALTFLTTKVFIKFNSKTFDFLPIIFKMVCLVFSGCTVFS